MTRAAAAQPDRHGAAGHLAVQRDDPREHRLRPSRRAPRPRSYAAAEATYVDRFVRSLPDGYDTVIDDEGGNISAGEKQLVTIARAFLADPALLILDEATSARWTPAPRCSCSRRWPRCASDRTSFVIAHRLSTIRDADLILVMQDGAIVEQGTHDEPAAPPTVRTSICTTLSSAPRTSTWSWRRRWPNRPGRSALAGAQRSATTRCRRRPSR